MIGTKVLVRYATIALLLAAGSTPTAFVATSSGDARVLMQQVGNPNAVPTPLLSQLCQHQHPLLPRRRQHQPVPCHGCANADGHNDSNTNRDDENSAWQRKRQCANVDTNNEHTSDSDSDASNANANVTNANINAYFDSYHNCANVDANTDGRTNIGPNGRPNASSN